MKKMWISLLCAWACCMGVWGENETSISQVSQGEVVICRGIESHTYSTLPSVGSIAPDFTAVSSELKEVSLSHFKGKRIVLNVFPSLDTPTCAMSVRQFNAEASSLENTVVLCISMDLPFAQSRFCTVEGLDRVIPLSVFRSKSFADGYGLRLTDGPLEGLMARAVVVIDEKGKIIYKELVRTISDEPDYEKAVSVLK